MIFVISTLEPMRIDLMPQWIAHYRALGAERFLLTLQTEPDLADSERVRVRERFTAMLAANGIDNPHFQVTPYNATALRNSHDALQRQHAKATDWIVWSDADEFQLYPAPLPDLAAWAGKYDINLFRGVMIDRVAADGGLPHWDPRRSVWEQFPLACFLPTRFGGGERQKITFARGDVTLSNGNHYVNAGQRVQTIGKWTQVHHFKWDATVKDRLAFRLLPAFRESLQGLDRVAALARLFRGARRALRPRRSQAARPSRARFHRLGRQRIPEGRCGIAGDRDVRRGFSLQPTAVAQTQRKSKF